MAASEESALRLERNRFVKLAFCRADILFELDRDFLVVFAAGATEALFGVTPEKLAGTSFLGVISVSRRAAMANLLGSVVRSDRINDVVTELTGPKGATLQAMMAGYRAQEHDNHFFIAIKITAPATPVAEPILNQEAFVAAAAERLKTHVNAGGEGQVTLLKIRKFKDLLEMLGVSDRLSLTSAICDVLKGHSLGGNTAGMIGEESFSYAHTAGIDTEKVNREVEEAAQEYLPDNRSLETKAMTLDADGAGMTEEQVAKALIHTMKQFCTAKSKVTASRLSDSLNDLMNGTADIVKFIKRASSNKEFDLVFMPVCDLRIGKVHHFEALSRFRDAEKARTTFQIITLAEELGLIVDFDYAVATKAIEMMDGFLKTGPMPPIAVNVSSISLGTPTFVERLHKRLAIDSGLNRRLMFELTESAEVEDLSVINKVIQTFRQKGFHFSLDDFGAGSASFDYLNALEVDSVKFDGPVVRRACASKRGHELLSTMAKMCSSAGVKTVGEMVEDKKIANQLFFSGIDYGQGWYFGKPDPNPFTFAQNFAGQK
ncbi:MAG: EAL domain-containing protein [Alphaproteobacteria bacterium]|nr:EAL domain-containing protein [Alphaproteobacteria bacterium]